MKSEATAGGLSVLAMVLLRIMLSERQLITCFILFYISGYNHSLVLRVQGAFGRSCLTAALQLLWKVHSCSQQPCSIQSDMGLRK